VLTERKRARDVSELWAQRADAAPRCGTAPGKDWGPTDVQSFYTIYCFDVLLVVVCDGSCLKVRRVLFPTSTWNLPLSPRTLP